MGLGAATGALAATSANFNQKGMAVVGGAGALFGAFFGYLLNQRVNEEPLPSPSVEWLREDTSENEPPDLIWMSK